MNNDVNQQKELFEKLRKLFSFLFAVQFSLLGIVLVVIYSNILAPLTSYKNELVWAAIVSNIIALLVLQFGFSVFMKHQGIDSKTNDKIEQFKYLTVFRLGILFIDNLINITALLLSQSWLPIIFYAIAIGFFFASRPTVKNFNKSYNETLKI